MNASRVSLRLRRHHLIVRVGAAVGLVLVAAFASYVLFRTFSHPSDSGTMTPGQRIELQTSYDAAVAVLKDDTNEGRLNDQQVKLVRGKLEEIYAFRQATNSNEQSGKEALTQKRRELREWAAKNGVSYHYFTGLFRQ